MIVRENINFERGIDPKEAMSIGNLWVRMKLGNIIECIKPLSVEKTGEKEYLAFQILNNKQGNYYTFEEYQAAVVKKAHFFEDRGVLEMWIIPADDLKSALNLRNNIISIEKSNKLSIFSSIYGKEKIETWKEYFKIIQI
jgi:hypothetical protein